MSNSYDVQDPGRWPEGRETPRDLDTQQLQPPARRDTDARSIRSRLIGNLQASMADAQDLANVYSNLARQIELQIILVETKQ